MLNIVVSSIIIGEVEEPVDKGGNLFIRRMSISVPGWGDRLIHKIRDAPFRLFDPESRKVSYDGCWLHSFKQSRLQGDTVVIEEATILFEEHVAA